MVEVEVVMGWVGEGWGRVGGDSAPPPVVRSLRGVVAMEMWRPQYVCKIKWSKRMIAIKSYFLLYG